MLQDIQHQHCDGVTHKETGRCICSLQDSKEATRLTQTSIQLELPALPLQVTEYNSVGKRLLCSVERSRAGLSGKLGKLIGQ